MPTVSLCFRCRHRQTKADIWSTQIFLAPCAMAFVPTLPDNYRNLEQPIELSLSDFLDDLSRRCVPRRKNGQIERSVGYSSGKSKVKFNIFCAGSSVTRLWNVTRQLSYPDQLVQKIWQKPAELTRRTRFRALYELQRRLQRVFVALASWPVGCSDWLTDWLTGGGATVTEAVSQHDVPRCRCSLPFKRQLTTSAVHCTESSSSSSHQRRVTGSVDDHWVRHKSQDIDQTLPFLSGQCVRASLVYTATGLSDGISHWHFWKSLIRLQVDVVLAVWSFGVVSNVKSTLFWLPTYLWE